jgi:hypothetical protein
VSLVGHYRRWWLRSTLGRGTRLIRVSVRRVAHRRRTSVRPVTNDERRL